LTVDWGRQTVLVTGGGGFIGSHLVERLVALGARTRTLVEYNSNGSWGWLDESPVRDEVEVFLGDVRDHESLRACTAGVDVLFHLAALIAIPYSYEAPLAYVKTNVEGTAQVLRAALDAGVGLVVHTSTSEVYGSARYVPIDEAHPLHAQSPYAASKIGGDKIAESFHLTYGLPVATLRPFNTYGPRQSARAVIPTIVTQALARGVVRLGNTSPTRDFTYVLDTVEAFLAVAACPAAVGRVVNAGTGSEVAIGDLARRIAALMGVPLELEHDEERVRPATSEVNRLCANASLLRELTGWEPRRTLDSGLADVVAWIGNNLGRYRVGAYTV
jgi:NAD dependent epimerase/dehydratase